MNPILTRIPQTLAAAAMGAALTAALIGGYAVTRASDSGNVIHACVSKTDGSVRIVSSSSACNTKRETYNEWNQQGPAGPTGEQGPAGPAGAPGTVSLASLDGTACMTAAGASGVVAVSVATSGTVSITCSAASTPVCTAPNAATATCNSNGAVISVTCNAGWTDQNNNPADGCEFGDADGDGYAPGPGADCNDANAAIYPGAPEANNLMDDDCDGVVDDGWRLTSTINFNPTSITPSAQATGTVTLNGPAVQDIQVTLGANAAVVGVPAFVTVPAGQAAATFTVTGLGSGTSEVTAALNGSTATGTITVNTF